MEDDVVPSSPAAFTVAVSMSLPQTATPAAPRGYASAPPKPPWHSVRLAKKVHSRTPAMLAAQHVLMKKLGITGDQPPNSDNVEAYVQAFHRGLTEDQARLIAELFIEHMPLPSIVGEEDGEAS